MKILVVTILDSQIKSEPLYNLEMSHPTCAVKRLLIPATELWVMTGSSKHLALKGQSEGVCGG